VFLEFQKLRVAKVRRARIKTHNLMRLRNESILVGAALPALAEKLLQTYRIGEGTSLLVPTSAENKSGL
jgi:hypothetical protein